MTVRWAGSADKHGVDRQDAMNAILHHVYRLEEFDEPRVGERKPDLFIGPTRDRSQLLEVVAGHTTGRHLRLPRHDRPAQNDRHAEKETR